MLEKQKSLVVFLNLLQHLSKVEATKFTEVGYVGRDVDQIVRDLIDSSIVMTKIK